MKNQRTWHRIAINPFYAGLILLAVGTIWANKVLHFASTNIGQEKLADTLPIALVGPQILFATGIVLLIYTFIVFCCSLLSRRGQATNLAKED